MQLFASYNVIQLGLTYFGQARNAVLGNLAFFVMVWFILRYMVKKRGYLFKRKSKGLSARVIKRRSRAIDLLMVFYVFLIAALHVCFEIEAAVAFFNLSVFFATALPMFSFFQFRLTAAKRVLLFFASLVPLAAVCNIWLAWDKNPHALMLLLACLPGLVFCAPAVIRGKGFLRVVPKIAGKLVMVGLDRQIYRLMKAADE